MRSKRPGPYQPGGFGIWLVAALIALAWIFGQ